MHYHKADCFCNDSIWGDIYPCNHMVVIEQFTEDLKNEPDWKRLIDSKFYFDERTYKLIKKHYKDNNKEPDEKYFKLFSEKETFQLKKEVMNWLKENIKDSNKGKKKGWCVGTDQYYAESSYFSIFFDKKADAIKFIEEWSIHRKPKSSFDYFK